MPNIADYLANTPEEIDPTSKGALLGIALFADDSFPFLVGATEILCEWEADPGVSCSVVLTTDTLEEFSASRHGWARKGFLREYRNGPRPGILVRRCQTEAHSPELDLFIMDLGAKRALLSIPTAEGPGYT